MSPAHGTECVVTTALNTTAEPLGHRLVYWDGANAWGPRANARVFPSRGAAMHRVKADNGPSLLEADFFVIVTVTVTPAGEIQRRTHGPDWEHLGARLRFLRLRTGRSQERVTMQLRDQLPLGRSGLADIENGARKVDGLELKCFARFYGVPVDDLLTGLGDLSGRTESGRARSAHTAADVQDAPAAE